LALKALFPPSNKEQTQGSIIKENCIHLSELLRIGAGSGSAPAVAVSSSPAVTPPQTPPTLPQTKEEMNAAFKDKMKLVKNKDSKSKGVSEADYK
jgi:hypothetical protein